MWDDEPSGDTELVKRLRAEISERDKKLVSKDEELKLHIQELAMLRPKVRVGTMKDVLADLKVNPRVAGLIPTDIDPDKDSVSKWLAEYGDVLGVKPGDTQEPAEGASTAQPVTEVPQFQPGNPPIGVNAETAQMWARIQSQDASAGSTTPDQEAQQLAQLTAAYTNAASSDEFFQFLQNAGGQAQ